MNLPSKDFFNELLNGLTIATLIFFPLINVLSGNNYEALHWNSQDTIETLISWMILGGVIGSLFFYISQKGGQNLISFSYMVMLQTGGFFVVGALIRNSELIHTLKSNHTVIYGVATIVAIFLITFTIWISFTSHNRYTKNLPKILILISPLNFLMVTNLFIAQKNISINTPSTKVESQEIAQPIAHIQPPLTVILLFDELSPDYLYGSRQVNLEKFPSLKTLISNSTLFTNAHLPGGATKEAISALFQYKSHGENLAEIFINEKSTASITGWHLDYCKTFLAQAINCRSISFFNARTLDNKFSPLNPIWTNFNLLPYQKPFGFMKIPAATIMHTQTLEKINKQLHDDLNNPALNLIYVHFNIPHLPMLGSKNLSLTDRERFEANEIRYINQLAYVEKAISMANDQINLISVKRPVNLFILSDHNIRNLTPTSEHERTTLLYHASSKIGSLPSIEKKKTNSAELIINVIKNRSISN